MDGSQSFYLYYDLFKSAVFCTSEQASLFCPRVLFAGVIWLFPFLADRLSTTATLGCLPGYVCWILWLQRKLSIGHYACLHGILFYFQCFLKDLCLLSFAFPWAFLWSNWEKMMPSWVRFDFMIKMELNWSKEGLCLLLFWGYHSRYLFCFYLSSFYSADSFPPYFHRITWLPSRRDFRCIGLLS